MCECIRIFTMEKFVWLQAMTVIGFGAVIYVGCIKIEWRRCERQVGSAGVSAKCEERHSIAQVRTEMFFHLNILPSLWLHRFLNVSKVYFGRWWYYALAARAAEK